MARATFGFKRRQTDKKRARLAGTSLGCFGLCAQIVGDWKMLKDIFRFPQHNETQGCCFLCAARPGDIRQTSTAAPWRQPRLGHWDLLERMQRQGRRVCPLFEAPGVTVRSFKIDWLHVADLGISADWLGQAFVFLLPICEGPSQEARVQGLWRRIQELYVECPCDSQLEDLTLNMLSPNARSPKLRGYGAECRGLVPIARRMASEMLADADGIGAAVREATSHLHACYEALSAHAVDASARLAEHCRKFCTLWVDLESTMPEIFRIKPKMHLFQELCEMQGETRPAMHWTYRDEDFGGSIVALGKRRGGHKSVRATSRQILAKFCARYPLPDFAPARP